MASAQKWLDICLDLAKNSSAAGSKKVKSRHGAIVVKRGRIIGAGVNVMRGVASVSQTDNSWRGSYVHAEEVALQTAGSKASGATLYVARIGKSHNALNSEPCTRCEGMIQRFGIKNVVWT